MDNDAQFYRFRNNRFELVTEAHQNEVQLEVADSWLVEDGRARSIDAHFERFEHWVTEVHPECVPTLPEFFDGVRRMIPATGRFFPRIEFHSEADSPNHLYLRMRQAPDQLGEIALWTLPEPDPRISPQVKGPDLSLCMQMRRNAKMHGADEAVILDSDGYVLEGALSSLVWWRGDRLMSSSDDLPWLPSITRDEVFAIARQTGFETGTERVTPSDLIGLEIWALSSLQGIRPVSNWLDLGGSVAKPTRVAAFSKRLRLVSSSIY